MTKTAIAAVLAMLLSACGSGPAGGSKEEIVLCGGNEVFIMDLAHPTGPEKVWSWKAVDRPELPEALQKKFGTTDDCKPVNGGREILISSSGGAVAWVERATGRVRFYASALNAHSLELLPGNRIAVASSYAEKGNKLLLFDGGVSEKLLASDDLFGAHGVVWDRDRARLWALGEKELRAYEIIGLETEAPELLMRQKVDLPDPGGHDLRPVPGSGLLVVTAHRHVWLFDRDRASFQPHPMLGDQVDVKSVDIDPASGRTIYTQAEEKWWTDRVRFLDPVLGIHLPGLRLYKARWATPTP